MDTQSNEELSTDGLGTYQLTHLGEGTDEAGDTDDPSISEELGHLGDTADVLLAVLLGEAQIFVQPSPDVISIQTVGRDALANQVLLQSKRDGCFPSTRQTWQMERSMLWSASRTT